MIGEKKECNKVVANVTRLSIKNDFLQWFQKWSEKIIKGEKTKKERVRRCKLFGNLGRKMQAIEKLLFVRDATYVSSGRDSGDEGVAGGFPSAVPNIAPGAQM